MQNNPDMWKGIPSRGWCGNEWNDTDMAWSAITAFLVFMFINRTWNWTFLPNTGLVNGCLRDNNVTQSTLITSGYNGKPSNKTRKRLYDITCNIHDIIIPASSLQCSHWDADIILVHWREEHRMHGSHLPPLWLPWASRNGDRITSTQREGGEREKERTCVDHLSRWTTLPSGKTLSP